MLPRPDYHVLQLKQGHWCRSTLSACLNLFTGKPALPATWAARLLLVAVVARLAAVSTSGITRPELRAGLALAG